MSETFVLLASHESDGEWVEIAGTKYHHLVRVRRVRVGDRLRAALPDGRVLLAEVSDISAEMLRARVTGDVPAAGVSPCRITLFQAVLKGEKMEWVVQKASELGVSTLVPVSTRRSIPQWTPAQATERAARWQRIAESAAEQCERSLPLLVATPCALSAALASLPATTLMLHEREGRSLPDIAASHPTLPEIGLFLGPEGGWADDEVQALQTAGVTPVHLGGRILRAETASLAAVTLAQYLWGDLA
ncbi:MAG TPA: 16S rRNA (uracil(1498)-N(3))-methyltransferase [Armatimonadota bacterium]|jgi:16S rRNA (uracil1498-N3)-methyltransferase